MGAAVTSYYHDRRTSEADCHWQCQAECHQVIHRVRSLIKTIVDQVNIQYASITYMKFYKSDVTLSYRNIRK